MESKTPLSSEKKIDVTGFGWLEEELAFLTKDKPVSIDFDAVENLRIVEHGSYELDIASLMKGDPLVVKSDKGIYYIKLPSLRKK
jgi:predicted  nucleic acid-binding Zn-ribbon protein